MPNSLRFHTAATFFLGFLSPALLFAADEKAKPDPKPAEAKAPAKAPEKKPEPKPFSGPKPTVEDLAYGKHAKQKLHFWQAKADKPTPVAFYVHGGGWQGGDRLRGMEAPLKKFLDAGISVVSVEYRFIPEATADGEQPPVRGPLHDAARALQTVRNKSAEWKIDKDRIGACGGSAGACTSLWLAFHNDLADPKSADPIARESTRLWCAAVNGPQTTLDPQQMKEWTPNSKYGGHAFGFKGDPAKNLSQFDEFLANREKILPQIAEYSPYALLTSDDPPIYMVFTGPPNLGKVEKDPTHSANFGVKLAERAKEVGVPAEVVYPGAPDVKHVGWAEYLIDELKAERKK